MKRYKTIYLLVLLGTVLIASVALAGSSDNYGILWDVMGRGGGEMSSNNFAIHGTAGQNIIGPGTSANYGLGAGYWYGLGGITFKGFDIYLPLINR